MLIAYSSQHWSYNSYFIIEKTEDQGNYRNELTSHSRSKWSCDGHRYSMTSKLILLTLFIVCQSSLSLTATKSLTGKEERKTMQKLSNNILSLFILVPLRSTIFQKSASDTTHHSLWKCIVDDIEGYQSL